MPTVYVVQENKSHNIVPAAKFGEIKILLRPGQFSFSVDELYEDLEKGLEQMTGEDFLLLSGDPIAIGVATLVAYDTLEFNERGDNLKFLKWDRQSQVYFETKMRIRENG